MVETGMVAKCKSGLEQGIRARRGWEAAVDVSTKGPSDLPLTENLNLLLETP